jgi:2-hydroxychromene-2-carboxylate isomerase
VGAPPARIEFWYEFASTYSYPSAMRIEALAAKAGVGVAWRPFLLGPIFHAQGWTTSPFSLYPAKGTYMVRDMQRLAGERGLPFRMPTPFPQNSLAAARLAVLGQDQEWAPAYTRAVYAAEFGTGADISDRAILKALLRELKLDADRLLARIDEDECKERLERQTGEAQARGVFGAPSFVVGEDLYWGDDRLEQALAYAARL